MTDGLEVATEESLAEDIAISMGAHVKPEETMELDEDVPKFLFDGAFQTKIAAMAMSDHQFLNQAEGLLRPEYFENQAEATLVYLSLQHYREYKSTPDKATMIQLMKGALASKLIRADMKSDVIDAFNNLRKFDISNRQYVVDRVSEFARHQAMGQAILDSVEFVEKNQFDKIFEVVKSAMDVGAEDDNPAYDFFAKIGERTQDRKDLLSGKKKKDGITTGIKRLDDNLYHGGWGKNELTVFMGAPKSGKSTALGEFAKSAALAGNNVLYVTLEVSTEIISERLDANISDVEIALLSSKINEVEKKINAAHSKAGRLMMNGFPTGSMSPSMLRRLIAKYKQDDIVFDLICVDYADIMRPDNITDSDINNSKSIYVDLRAIAQEEHLAMLTATQTNREGAKSSVAKMEHVAEDFNRIRIADLVISINKTDDEKAAGEARLFMAASRNQKGDLTIHIEQDMERMRFITKILRIV